MATEENKFDKYLKEHLYRDLIFRGAILAVLNSYAIYYTTTHEHIDPLKLMMQTTDKLMAALNSIGYISLILSVVALMLKDLEHMAPNNWGQSTKIGSIGCVIRRQAGDLTLWSTGAVFSIFILTVFALFFSQSSANTKIILAAFTVPVTTWLLTISGLNILVRREGPTLAPKKLRTTTHLITGYSLFLALLTIGGLLL